ncbi:hypothetical protein V8D89_016259, partial [Ganoderma adspersum]
MSANLRYNLRNRASGPRPGTHSGLAPLPDGEHSDAASVASSARSSVRPGVLYSQATSHRVGADTVSLSDQEANPRVSGADTVPSNGREAYPCSHTPQSGTAGAPSLSNSDKENIIPSSPSRVMDSSLTEMNVTSEDVRSTGPWTEVRRKKRRAHSLDSVNPQDITPPRTVVVPPAGTTLLNDEQQRTVRAAENSLSKEERGRIEKRMHAVNKPRDETSSRGEGPSTRAKGKMVDARNWGAVGIDPAELDPKAQRKALAQFSAHKPAEYYNSDEDSEEEREAQEAALQYYAAIKSAKRRTKPTVRTVTDESDQDRVARQARKAAAAPPESCTSSRMEPTSREDLERQITALRRELDDVWRARSISEQHAQSLPELLQTEASSSSRATTSHARSRDNGVTPSNTGTA